MDFFLTPAGLLDFFTLSTLEIVLGIDNVIFIAIIIQNLPSENRNKARIAGLGLAFIMRVVMLFGASWIITLTQPLFTLFNFDFSGRSLLLLVGGAFLIGKSILEIVELFTDEEFSHSEKKSNEKKYWKSILQIVFVDLILSFDSIITAVGMTNNLYVIIAAIIIAMIAMLLSSEHIGNFIYKHPTVKVIALCFIVLVGVMLIFNGLSIEFPKAYLYSTMFFSMTVEIINIMLKRKQNKEL